MMETRTYAPMGRGLKKEDSAALKGAAVMMMVFHHCYRAKEKFEAYDLVLAPFQEDQLIRIGLLMKLCVAVFAFVSGFGLMYSYMAERSKERPVSDKGWILRHLLSTCSGFWFLVIPGYLVYGLGHENFRYSAWGGNFLEKAVNMALDGAGLSGLFDTKSVNGAWWYMSAAIVFIVLLPFFAKVEKAYGGLACFVVLSALPRMMGDSYPGGRSPLSFMPALLAGMLFCKYNVFEQFHKFSPLKNKRTGDLLKAIVLGGLLFAGAWGYCYIDMKEFWEYHYLLVPLLVVLFLKEYVFRLKPLYMLLGFFGKHSLNIWLIHTFVRDYLSQYVWRIKYFLAPPVLILLISLAASVVITFVRKKSGYDKWIRNLASKVK